MLQFNNDIISGEVSQSVQTDIFADFHWIIIFSSGKAWINPEGRTEEPKDPDFFYPFWSTESRLFLRKFVHYKSSHWSKKKWFADFFFPNILIEVSSLAACSDYVIMQMKEIDERLDCVMTDL